MGENVPITTIQFMFTVVDYEGRSYSYKHPMFFSDIQYQYHSNILLIINFGHKSSYLAGINLGGYFKSV